MRPVALDKKAEPMHLTKKKTIKKRAVFIMMALILFFTGCAQSSESLVEDLTGDNPQLIEKAVKKLSEDPLYVHRIVAALSTPNTHRLKRYMRVIDAAGETVLDDMTAHVEYIRLSKDHYEQFLKIFNTRQNEGKQALFRAYLSHADLLGAGQNAGQMGGTVLSHFERMKDIARLLKGMKIKGEYDDLPTRLTHPFEGARTELSRLLCDLGWAGPNEKETETVIYYSNLVGYGGCEAAKNAKDKVVALAKSDLPVYLAAEQKYPSAGDTRYRVLIAAGTDDVVKYVEKRCRETDNPFVLEQYFEVLSQINTPASKSALVRLKVKKAQMIK